MLDIRCYVTSDSRSPFEDWFASLDRAAAAKVTVAGEAVGTQPKSLIRMFGARGNPQARNLFGVSAYLQREAGVELHVASERR